jgi:hypothetical protein
MQPPSDKETKDRKRRAVADAVAMFRADPPVRYMQIVARLVESYDVTERTAKRWVSDARKAHLAEDFDLKPDDLEGARWGKVASYEKKISMFQRLGQDALEGRAPDGKPRPPKPDLSVKFFRLGIYYERLLIELLHLDQIPPDRELSQPEIRGIVIREVSRNIDKFTRIELETLLAAVSSQLEELIREGEDPEAKREYQAYLAEAGEVIG